ncbi:MAG: tail fiber domain-containing protein [Saprospiraceae bacterium]
MTNRHLLLFGLLAFLFTAWRSDAQTAPQGFSYQCIVRDINGASLNNQTVSLLFTLRNGAPNGPVAYSEMQSTSTNAYGLVNLVIGQGTALQGNFNTINWGASAKYLTVSLETSPNVFDELGTSQLMSVPYALFSQNTAASGDNWGTQTVQTSTVLGGNGTAGTPLTIAQQGAQPGQVLKWDGTTWVPQDDNTGQSGTVSEVNTGAGLTGGPITTTGTISLATTPVAPGIYGGPTEIPVVTIDQYGRVTNVSTVAIPNNNITITGASGIGVTQNGQNFTVTNTGDTNATDDLTTSTVHDGDVTGPYSNLQIKPNAVGNPEIADNAVGTSKITDGAVNTAKIADGAVNTAKLADNAVNTAKIADNAVSTAKLANGSVTAAKLNDMGASSGQVLKWTGTTWAPAQDALGTVSITGGTGITISGTAPNFTVTNSGDTNANDDLLISTAHDGDVAGPFNNLQLKSGVVSPVELANNAVTTSKINAQAVSGDKIDQMSAANGHVLKWNGTTWSPAPDNLGTVTITGGVGIDVIAVGQNFTIANGGDINPFDDLTTNSTADGDVTGPFSNLQLKNNVVTSFELANNAVQTAKIQNAAVTGDKLAQMGAFNGQVLKWNGTTWAPAQDTGPDNWGTQSVVTTASLSGFGTPGNPLTIDQQGATNGQVLKWNGAAWVPGNDNNAGADNWGTQTAVTNTTIAGNGTAGSPLGIAPQGATNGQVLKFNGLSWLPADDQIGADNWGTQTAQVQPRLLGNGTAANPLDLAQQGATNGQILKWNGTSWAPAADNTGADNWGTQTAQTTARLAGNGTAGTPLDLAQQGASNGQVLKWDGSAWTPAADNNSGADNWGTQTAATNATLIGNGTAGTPLGIAQQGAGNGQVLKWNGTSWAPAADNNSGPDNWGTQTAITNATLTGNGTAGAPLAIAQQGAGNGQVLKWNGTDWAPAADNNSGPDNWGTQKAATNATITGDGLPGTPLGIAQQGASNGQVLKWNGTDWAPAADNNSGPDNWGTQTAQTTARLAGNGTAGTPLDIAQQGAASGQVLKWNGSAWAPSDDNTGSGPADNWGTQVAITDATLDGDGTAGDPLKIAAQGATNGQVLKFNGTTWVPQNEAGGDNWGTQTAATALNISGNGTVGNPLRLNDFGATNGQVLAWNSTLNLFVPEDESWGTQTAQTTARLSGNGTAGTPLDIAQQGAASGQVLKWNGSAWAPSDDNTGAGPADNWGTQVAITALNIAGNGTAGDPLRLNQLGATNGQTLKWDQAMGLWEPADDNGNSYVAGTGISITGTAPNFTINNTGDADADPINEIQALSLVGQDLSLSKGGGTVTLPASNSYTAGTGINITGTAPNFTIENTGDADKDPTNELQTLSLNGTKLAISGTNSEVDFDTLFTSIGGGFWSANGANIHNANAGFVGVGTDKPVRQLHVKSNGEAFRIEGMNPAIGFASGMNVAASITKDVGNFVIASDDSSSIVLSTGAGKTVFVDGLSGQVGMGSPNVGIARLKLFHATGSAGLMIQNSNSGGEWDFRVNGFDGSLNLHNNFFGGGLPVGTFATNGFYIPSDRRFKKDVAGTGSVLDKVSRLNTVYYRYNHEKAEAKRTIGVIAQEVEVLFPELVNQHRTDDGSIYLGVNYAGFGVLAIKAIQEQQEQISALQQENTKLQQRMNSLESRIQNIETARASREK